jgi:hypothetical protein
MYFLYVALFLNKNVTQLKSIFTRIQMILMKEKKNISFSKSLLTYYFFLSIIYLFNIF